MAYPLLKGAYMIIRDYINSSIETILPLIRKPTHAEIARVAHRFFLEQGSQPGFELDDWLRAEHFLLEEIRQAALPSLSSNTPD